VYGLVRNVIANSPAFGDDTPPVKWEDPEWSLFMAFEHERIHIETSSVLIREMPLKFLKEPQWVRSGASLCGSSSLCLCRSGCMQDPFPSAGISIDIEHVPLCCHFLSSVMRACS
jgi:hypothetical protein